MTLPDPGNRTPTTERTAPDGINRSTPIARSATVVGVATMTSRLLGLVRDLSLAYYFGASNAMDAFFVAFRIPNLLRDLFAEGVMSAAFVPTFTRRLTTSGRAAAWRLGTQLINSLLLITGTIVILGIVFAEPITRLFAQEFSSVPGKLELTIQLTRVMLPFLTLVALAVACMGMLNSLNRFFVPALSPAMYNVSLILSAALLAPLMSRVGLEPIMAIAIGVILGGVGQIAAQYWMLRREGFRYRLSLNLQDRGLREILGLMGPGTLAGAAMQVNLLVNTILATSQGEGAVSWLTYAFRIMYLPIGIFGVSIATAALPVLSRQAAMDDLPEMRRTIAQGLRLMLVLMVPAAVGLIVLAEPIVQLIFERGSFTREDTQATALALACYAPAVVGYSAVRLAVPGFYALGTSLPPAIISMVTVGLNIVLNLLLVRTFGYPGLALGTAIAALANAGMLLTVLGHRLGGLELATTADCFLRISLASLIMGIMVTMTDHWLTVFRQDGNLSLSVLTLGSEIVVGVVTLATASRLLGIAEFSQVKNQLLTLLSRFRSG
ncbi:MAG: murein biosynthesis integral membrane protein MurJ [Acidobacteria bacterium]|nr:murein biosynthesis integral membrane protein MurJ [Acidobacteriota bacterium]